jgi:aminoglycoside 2''-phosphotransferase
MNTEPYKKLIEEFLPQLHIRTIEPILQGWDSTVFEVNGEYIFRFPKRPDVEAQLEKEILLLPELAKTLPVRVPHFEFISRRDENCSASFVGYRKIEGVPLTNIGDKSARLIRPLAEFLTELHRFPVERAVRLRVPDHTPAQWRAQFADFYAWVQKHVFPLLTTTQRAQAATLWENFINPDADLAFQPVLIHADLDTDHIFCDPERGTLTGVIDWGDAAIGDPALDFVGLLDVFGQEFVERAAARYQGQVDATFWDRMVFYSKIIPFHEVRYGMTIGDEVWIKRGLTRIPP